MRPTDEAVVIEELVTRSRCYAGIGSRAAPCPVLALIGEIAARLVGRGLTLRSGGSPGADTAFEQGCDRTNGAKEIFLPWEGFNGNHSPLFDPPERAGNLAALCHPKWRACSPAARKLHARNCQQVYGVDLVAPVDFVLFWAPEENGVVKGGTATAVFLAQQMAIPTFNLWETRCREAWVRWGKAGET